MATPCSRQAAGEHDGSRVIRSTRSPPGSQPGHALFQEPVAGRVHWASTETSAEYARAHRGRQPCWGSRRGSNKGGRRRRHPGCRSTSERFPQLTHHAARRPLLWQSDLGLPAQFSPSTFELRDEHDQWPSSRRTEIRSSRSGHCWPPPSRPESRICSARGRSRTHSSAAERPPGEICGAGRSAARDAAGHRRRDGGRRRPTRENPGQHWVRATASGTRRPRPDAHRSASQTRRPRQRDDAADQR